MKKLLFWCLLAGLASVARADTVPNPAAYEVLYTKHVSTAPTGACGSVVKVYFARDTSISYKCDGVGAGTWVALMGPPSSTAVALAADPANCPSGQAAGGVTAAGTGEACVDPIVNLGTDPVGTLPGTSGGTGRTTNPQHQIVIGGATNAQNSDSDFEYRDSSGTQPSASHELHVGYWYMYDDPVSASPLGIANLTASQPFVNITNGYPNGTMTISALGGLSLEATNPSSALQLIADGIGVTVENAQTTIGALVSNSGSLTNANVQASTLIAPNSTGSLPAVEVTPGALYVSYATTPATIYTARDTNSDGTADTWEPSGTNAAPPGSNKNVPFNNSGAYGADSGFEYDPTLNQLSTQGPVVAGSAVADGARGIEAGQNTVNPGATTSGRYRFHFMGDEAYGLSSSGSTPGVLFANVGNEYASGDLTLTEATGRKVDYQVKSNVLGTAEIDETQQYTWTTRQTFSKTGGGASGGTGDGDGAIWLTGADAYIRGPNTGKITIAAEDTACGASCTDLRFTIDAATGAISFTGGAPVSSDGGFSSGTITGTNVNGTNINGTTITATGGVSGATGAFNTTLTATGNVDLGTLTNDTTIAAGAEVSWPITGRSGSLSSKFAQFVAFPPDTGVDVDSDGTDDAEVMWCLGKNIDSSGATGNCGNKSNASDLQFYMQFDDAASMTPTPHRYGEWFINTKSPDGSVNFVPWAFHFDDGLSSNTAADHTASLTVKGSPTFTAFQTSSANFCIGATCGTAGSEMFQVHGRMVIDDYVYMASANGFYMDGATAGGNLTHVVAADPSAARTITLPNETGTVCTTGSVCSGYLSTSAAAASANALKSATTTVDVVSATAPTAGQSLTASSGTAATWKNVSRDNVMFYFQDIAGTATNVGRPSGNGNNTRFYTPLAITLNSVSCHLNAAKTAGTMEVQIITAGGTSDLALSTATAWASLTSYSDTACTTNCTVAADSYFRLDFVTSSFTPTTADASCTVVFTYD